MAKKKDGQKSGKKKGSSSASGVVVLILVLAGIAVYSSNSRTKEAVSPTLPSQSTRSVPQTTQQATSAGEMIDSMRTIPSSMPTEKVNAVEEISERTYFTSATANLRPCPELNERCAPVTQLSGGVPVVIDGLMRGEDFRGSTAWYRTYYNGQAVYVHESLLSANSPAVQGGTSNQSVAPPAPVGASCPGLSATCAQLTCEQAYACLRAGNGRLDRDGDGVPCESICPGG